MGSYFFEMSSPGFMNVVRYRLKPELVDKYFEKLAEFNSEGLITKYVAKTGDNDYCFVGLWESEEAIAAARPKMISHLDQVRDFMEELSPELGVTDPVSGPIVAN